MTNRVSPRFVLPVLALVLVVVASFVPEPEPATVDGGERAVPVEQASWACPTQQNWTVMAGQVKAGTSAQAVTIPDTAADLAVFSDAASWRSAVPGPQALVLSQEGKSSGPVGYVAGRGTKDQGEGSAFSACPSIIDEAWFVGLADSDRTAAKITLVNLGSERAVADVSWWGELGAIESSDTAGLVVEGGKTKVVEVEAVAAGEAVVAVRVSRRRGALSAIATDAGSGGIEVVAPTSALAKSQVLVGPPTTAGARLAVVNPSTSTAHVKVEVRGPAGSFSAQGLEDIAVPPESVRVVAVPAQVELAQSALSVTSDLPVVASLTVATADDIATVVPASALTGPAAVPTELAGLPVQLVVSAAESAATVEVEDFTAQMESLGTAQVDVAAGSAVLAPKPKMRDSAYRVIRPVGEGKVWVGANWRDKNLIAASVVRPAPLTVIAPGVSVR
ncbi:MAG TPA: DUF5719 family protein [Aeromicrobium sp.]|nr:DUF5719 family protein [Aeromicrobium sp.]